MALAGMTQEETNKANYEHCKHIADTLELIANSLLYRCSECGEFINIEEHEDNEELYEAIENGDTCSCPECGEAAEFEQVSMFDWLEDVLDFDYIIDSNKQYKAARIMVACGGPSIYVDTWNESVNLYWWTDRASYSLSREACIALDKAMEELYNC